MTGPSLDLITRGRWRKAPSAQRQDRGAVERSARSAQGFAIGRGGRVSTLRKLALVQDVPPIDDDDAESTALDNIETKIDFAEETS